MSEFKKKLEQLYYEDSDTEAMPRSALKTRLDQTKLLSFLTDLIKEDKLYYYENSPSRGLTIIDRHGDVVTLFPFEE